jgi:hypothetical protein
LFVGEWLFDSLLRGGSVRKVGHLVVFFCLLMGASSFAGGGSQAPDGLSEAQELTGVEAPDSNKAMGARATALLHEAPGFKKSLLGESSYIIMLNDKVAIGSFTQTVSRGSKKDKATYRVDGLMEMRIGPRAFRMDEQAWLASDASVLKLRQMESEAPEAPDQTPKITEISKSLTQEGWVFTKLDSGGRSREGSLTEQHAHWGEVSSLLTFLRMADLSLQGQWMLNEVVWDGPGAELRAAEMRLTVGAPISVTHHGRAVEAVEVEVDKHAEKSNFIVSKDGAILVVIPRRGQAVKLVACEGEECASLLEPPALEGPAAAVLILFEVTAGARDKGELDQVMAWEQIAEHKQKEGIQESAAETKALFLQSLSEVTQFDAEFLKILPMMLETELEGERATVTLLDGGGFKIVLGLVEGSWKVVEFPL